MEKIKKPRKKATRKKLDEVLEDFCLFMNSWNKTMLEMKKCMDEHEKILSRIARTNENAEETLCNVLLAIRQNEYLQAWYPAQHGFSEMKVTGKHPAKEVS